MSIITRVTMDMFEFEAVMDYMVNPCNLQGAAGKGLSLEFRRRTPSFLEIYREQCRSKELRMGTVTVIEETEKRWGIINLPTKEFWANPSSKDDIVKGLSALRSLLKQDRYRYASVGLPMLGCGEGKQDYAIVHPLMIDYLSDLDATIFLSMSPERTDLNPRYLTIVGPMDYGVGSDPDANVHQQNAISWGIEKALEAWGTKIGDYEGVVSGGYPGTDAFVGGTDFLKNVEETYVYQKTGKPALVVKPNIARNGIGANLQQGNLLCEIGDDIILFKPKGHNNNRMSAMQTWLENDRVDRTITGLVPRRVAIFGEKDPLMTKEDILIPQSSEIPY